MTGHEAVLFFFAVGVLLGVGIGRLIGAHAELRNKTMRRLP